jgi:starch phosphorylase
MNIRHKLARIAANIWWTWTPDARQLFTWIDEQTWEASNHNALAVLAAANESALQAAFKDDARLDTLDRVYTTLCTYLANTDCWLRKNAAPLRRGLVAYFCAEFGMHESLPLYSGGLGILAGDHVKTASDLGIPFVGIGLKYPEGYFQQSIDATGMQQEAFPGTDWTNIPSELMMSGGQPILVDMPLADRTIYAQVWRMQVGRATLYLLDTNIALNNAQDRTIGGRLYSGGSETRIRQEVVLGLGGVRLLRKLALEPTVYHLNEGHCAFAAFELMRERRDLGASFDEALAWVRARTLFTTHTPVPAGHDRFAPDLVQMMLWQPMQALKVDWHTFLGLGRVNPHDMNETFCMTVLAMKSAQHINGVSELHGQVTREMWTGLWPGWRVEDIPVGFVTNGIHAETFMHPHLRKLMEERHGDAWQDALQDNVAWASMIQQWSDDEIVAMKRVIKKNMFDTLMRRMDVMRARLGPDTDASIAALGGWRTDTLTLGFARRFATYKRGDMLIRDIEKAVALFADANQPVQIIFSGKAHPQDTPGKQVIQRVIEATRNPRLRGRVLFMENYDMAVGRALVSGVDVWLNTPRRPREASGTSGQKVCMHAGVNVSILDGWWAEGYNGENGYAVGDQVVLDNTDEQDARDSAFLWDVLRNHVIPDYYEKTPGGSGPRWVSRMRGSMTTLPAQFATRRMLADYVRKFYLPIHVAASASR